MNQTEIEITKKGYQCLRCGHSWIPRQTGRPHICPKCKSALWDVPKRKGGLIKSKMKRPARTGLSGVIR